MHGSDPGIRRDTSPRVGRRSGIPQKCVGAVIDLFKFSMGRLSRSGQEIHWVIEYLQSKPIGEGI